MPDKTIVIVSFRGSPYYGNGLSAGGRRRHHDLDVGGTGFQIMPERRPCDFVYLHNFSIWTELHHACMSSSGRNGDGQAVCGARFEGCLRARGVRETGGHGRGQVQMQESCIPNNYPGLPCFPGIWAPRRTALVGDAMSWRDGGRIPSGRMSGRTTASLSDLAIVKWLAKQKLGRTGISSWRRGSCAATAFHSSIGCVFLLLPQALCIRSRAVVTRSLSLFPRRVGCWKWKGLPGAGTALSLFASS